jgi:ribosome biogenesis protein Nip4
VKVINDFVKQFDATVPLDKSCVVRNRNRYYLLPKKMKQQIPKGFFHAGAYLGAIKGNSFFPSFLLLAMIGEHKANKLVIDKKTAWLFICGRDLFKHGIVKGRNLKKGDYTLILNQHDECLGFGKVMHNLLEELEKKEVAVKNVLDIGDFLRREKRQPRRKKGSDSYRKPQKQVRR